MSHCSSKGPRAEAPCPGCDQSFSLQGYQSHLALLQDPLCHAVFDKLKRENEVYEQLMSAKENLRSGADTNTVLFQGDASGTAEDYASDTFGQTMDDSNTANLPPLMEASDDEDDDNKDNKEELEMVNMVAELEKS